MRNKNDFSKVRLIAEGGSVASFFRTLNLYLGVFTGRWWGKPIRMLLDRRFSGGDGFVANWLAIARKDR